MHRLNSLFLLLPLGIVTAVSPAFADEPGANDSATVQISISVQPFTELTLTSNDELFTADENGTTVFFGGRVLSNVNVQLTFNVTPPSGEEGSDWQVYAGETSNEDTLTVNKGDNTFDKLMRLSVQRYEGAGSRTFDLNIGATAELLNGGHLIRSDYVQITPQDDGQPGELTIQVMQNN